MVHRGSVVGLAALAALAICAVGAGAAAPTVVSVAPGDAITISGTSLQCTVTTTAPVALACEIGTTTTPVVHSYATAVSDAEALIFESTGRPDIVAMRREPTVSGALQHAPHHRPAHYTLGTAVRIAVAGSHIECATSAAATPALTCGLLSAPGAARWAAGSYVAVISARAASVERVAAGGALSTVVSKRQP